MLEQSRKQVYQFVLLLHLKSQKQALRINPHVRGQNRYGEYAAEGDPQVTTQLRDRSRGITKGHVRLCSVTPNLSKFWYVIRYLRWHTRTLVTVAQLRNTAHPLDLQRRDLTQAAKNKQNWSRRRSAWHRSSAQTRSRLALRSSETLLLHFRRQSRQEGGLMRSRLSSKGGGHDDDDDDDDDGGDDDNRKQRDVSL
ncbi:hypothetical protein ElyMa_005854100 [Elysia marginata]|uniref:Uncharacterized protein n=1 Tax=Elysia marginata TaxID=1093978 RepID=A0AAV4G0H3_9GAST|nr:hypothetical protein ElyMa_005854100 [Elysia marginata]